MRSLSFERPYAFVNVCCAIVFLFLAGSTLRAQTTSTVEGTVKDKQGLAVSGAQIQVVSGELAIDRSATTDS